MGLYSFALLDLSRIGISRTLVPRSPKKKIFTCLFLFVLLFSCHPKKKIDYIELRIGVDHNPSEINPLTTDTTFSANLINLLFDSLLTYAANGDLAPNLAERWETSSDGLTWTFFIRPGIRFHDGHPLTSQDVKFTFDFMKGQEKCGYTHFLRSVREIRAEGELKVVVVLEKYDNKLPVLFTEIGIAPRHLLNQGDPASFDSFNQKPIGSGPYRFEGRDHQKISLIRFQDYYSPGFLVPRISIVNYPDQRAVLSHLISEQIDMVFLTNPEDYGALERIGSIKVHDVWSPILYSIIFNSKREPFKETRVRQALSQIIDKTQIIEKTLKGKVIPAKGTISPDSSYYASYRSRNLYDPQKAVEILAQQGWKDADGDHILEKKGKKFQFKAYAFEGETVAQSVLRTVQKQLLDVGIRMDIHVISFQDYILKIFKEHDFEANIVCNVMRSIYDNDFLFWHSSQIKSGLNFSNYRNSKVDRLLEEMRTERHETERHKLFLDFQDELGVDPPGIFLFWRKMPIAINARFKGFPTSKVQSLRDFTQMYVEN